MKPLAESSLETLNAAATQVLQILFAVSELADHGDQVTGILLPELGRKAIYNHLVKKVREEATWADIVRADIEQAEQVTRIYDTVSRYLVQQEFAESRIDLTAYRAGIRMTPTGFRLCLRAEKDPDLLNVFKAKPAMPRPPKPPPPLPPFLIPPERLPELKLELLKMVHNFATTYKKKLWLYELCIRYAVTIDSRLSKFGTLSELQKAAIYSPGSIDALVRTITGEVVDAYRSDLLYFDINNSMIDITPKGSAFLMGDSAATVATDIAPALSTTSIVHVSDIHCGSLAATGVENKGTASEPLGVGLDPLAGFIKAAKPALVDGAYLIVSGDITSKNEEAGYRTFVEKLRSWPVDVARVYVVPGNHDCNRAEATAEAQFAFFSSYFSKFAHPFARDAFLLDQENRVFVFGFNSVHVRDKEELFYINEPDINEAEDAISRITKRIPNFSEYLKIAVLHNHVVAHPNVDLKQHADILNLFRFKFKLVELGFNVVLSGHKHAALVERHVAYYDELDGDILIVSAASLGGPVSGGKNGFQIIDFRRDATSGKLYAVEVQVFERAATGDFRKVGVKTVRYY